MNYLNNYFIKNIISRVHVKLQYINLILPDQDYLDYIENLENFEKFTAGIEDSSYAPQIELSSARKRFANITEKQKILSELLQVKREHLEKADSKTLYVQFLNEIEASIGWATQSIQNFREEIAKCCKRIYDIKQLIRILNFLRELKFSLTVILNNFINWVKLASLNNIKDILTKIYTKACSNIECRTKLVCKSFSPPKSLTTNFSKAAKSKSVKKQKMDETVKREIDERRKEVSMSKADISVLKKSMFNSATSLATQEKKTKSEIEQKTQTVRSHMDSIAELEGRIDNMDEQLSQITINKEETLSKIKTQKQQLENTIVELIRLEALLEDINAESRQKSSLFKVQMETFELKRDDILNDEHVTEEQKTALIENLNRDIVNAKAKHKESMHALEIKRTDIQKMAQKRTESLMSLKQGVKEKYLEEIEKLQQKKLEATESEALRLNEQINKLKETMNEDMKSWRRFQTESEEEYDEYGEEEEDRSLNQQEESKSTSQIEVVPADSSIDVSKMGNADYIRHTVGKPLARALAMVCVQQPEDPISFLANYFLQYHYNQERNRELVKGFDELLATGNDTTN